MGIPWSNEEIRQKFLEHGWSPEGAQSFVDHRHEVRAQQMIARLFGVKIRFPSPSDGTKAWVPHALRWQIWERDNFTCQHCGCRQFLTIDHKYPERLGGSLNPDNLQTLCSSCNSTKGYRA
jgi:5-methylcytosine-specific restriction endonuclease McrA